MGKQRKIKEDRKKILKRVELLEKIKLPYPEELEQAPYADALIRIYTEAASRFVEPMGDSLTPGSLKEGVHRLLRYLDELLEQIPKTVNFANEGRVTVACKAGCNYCCTIRVTTIAPMVLALAAYLKKKLSQDDLDALLARMRAHVEEGLKLSPLDQVLKSRMCPLNVDGLCIGYEFRPNTCRYYHSFNVDRCKEDMEAPIKEVNVPMDPQRLGMNGLITKALHGCLPGLNLNDTEIEFVPALLIALTNDDTAERYIRGEDVFADANRPDVKEAQMRDMSNRGLPLPMSKS